MRCSPPPPAACRPAPRRKSDTSLPVSTGAKELTTTSAVALQGRIEQGWMVSDGGAIVVERALVARYASGAHLLATWTKKPEGAFVARSGDGLVVWTEREAWTLDGRLRETADCRLPEGTTRAAIAADGGAWRFWVLARGGHRMLMDLSTCRTTRLPGFVETARGASDEVLVSRNGTRVGVLRGFCAAVDVFDAATMTKMSTERAPSTVRHASAKGCDAIALSDDGEVTWMPRGQCAVGSPMTFLSADVAAREDAVAGIVVERGARRTPCKNLGFTSAEVPELETEIVRTIGRDALAVIDPEPPPSRCLLDGRGDVLLVAGQRGAAFVQLTSRGVDVHVLL